ncbi:MAG: hypothetical protein QNJ98_07960 [Planctomycetota bacterium]|nr:hypothetical protein [Planctomycetota bacterium]
MLCKLCKKKHADWEHAVFYDTTPTRVRLCLDCAKDKDADGHMERIHAAEDHEAKNAAVAKFLSDLGM